MENQSKNRVRCSIKTQHGELIHIEIRAVDEAPERVVVKDYVTHAFAYQMDRNLLANEELCYLSPVLGPFFAQFAEPNLVWQLLWNGLGLLEHRERVEQGMDEQMVKWTDLLDRDKATQESLRAKLASGQLDRAKYAGLAEYLEGVGHAVKAT